VPCYRSSVDGARNGTRGSRHGTVPCSSRGRPRPARCRPVTAALDIFLAAKHAAPKQPIQARSRTRTWAPWHHTGRCLVRTVPWAWRMLARRSAGEACRRRGQDEENRGRGRHASGIGPHASPITGPGVGIVAVALGLMKAVAQVDASSSPEAVRNHAGAACRARCCPGWRGPRKPHAHRGRWEAHVTEPMTGSRAATSSHVRMPMPVIGGDMPMPVVGGDKVRWAFLMQTRGESWRRSCKERASPAERYAPGSCSPARILPSLNLAHRLAPAASR
jgi:hypothetical protein